MWKRWGKSSKIAGEKTNCYYAAAKIHFILSDHTETEALAQLSVSSNPYDDLTDRIGSSKWFVDPVGGFVSVVAPSDVVGYVVRVRGAVVDSGACVGLAGDSLR